MLGMLLLMLVAGIACFLALAAVGRRQRAQEQQQRIGRVAQRVAPPTPTAEDTLGVLLAHVDEQLHRLHGERAQVRRLRDRGARLRREMQRSEALRERLPALERSLEALARRAAALDTLIGQYTTRRDDLRVLRGGTAFLVAVAELQADPIDSHAVAVEQLDQETTRLLDVAEAAAELDELLRA